MLISTESRSGTPAGSALSGNQQSGDAEEPQKLNHLGGRDLSFDSRKAFNASDFWRSESRFASMAATAIRLDSSKSPRGEAPLFRLGLTMWSMATPILPTSLSGMCLKRPVNAFKPHIVPRHFISQATIFQP